jgi:hypothetical protein
MINLSIATIEYLKNKLLKGYEVCVRLKENRNNELDIESRIKGDVTNRRKSCNWGPTPLTRVILHTHPTVSKHYPSVEDYSKIYKNKYVDRVEHSLIYTPVGVFQLTNMKYGQSYINNEDDEEDLIFMIKVFDLEFYQAYDEWRRNNDLEELKIKYSNITNRMNQVLHRIKLVFYPF